MEVLVRQIWYFVLGFLAMFFICFIPVFLQSDLKLTLILCSIFGSIMGLFSLGFMQRTLKYDCLEVNSGNKALDRNMKWYEDRIREQINDLPFYFSEMKDGIEQYKPRGLYRVYEPTIKLEVTPYDIRVEASRLMIRLISVYVEIPSKSDSVDQQTQEG